MTRTNWKISEIEKIYHKPLMELMSEAVSVHKQHFKPGEILVCSLISIKTGGCSEDCSYCSQSAKYDTSLKPHKLLDTEEVVNAAAEAKTKGANRFCMGAAWRELRDNRDLEKITTMVEAIAGMGMEVCCSLGMVSKELAIKLKKAGLTAYNHNLDTSAEYYENVVSTRNYMDRLETLKNIREAGINICSGGILGLGESNEDRISMIHTFATMPIHPESVPVNILVPIKGTPLENVEKITIWETLRVIATMRMVMPASRIRLAAGRSSLSESEQALCFMAGANSIFSGEKLLTTPNTKLTKDQELFKNLGFQNAKPETTEEQI
ncbi:biotin synthase BioB [Cytophagaceae bacterium ABcell3]|nr:biotin synthase BioB [Cytophagaceae bacterium ABcell3]